MGTQSDGQISIASPGVIEGYEAQDSVRSDIAQSMSDSLRRATAEAQDAMRSHVHQQLSDTLQPLVDRVVASENHIENLAANVLDLDARFRQTVVEDHGGLLERHTKQVNQLTSNLAKAAGDINEMQTTLDSTIKEQTRLAAQWDGKLQAFRTACEVQLQGMLKLIDNNKSDIVQLQTSLDGTNKNLADSNAAIRQQRDDHQDLVDQYLASEKVNTQTKQIGQQTRKNLLTLGMDFEQHQHEFKTHCEHITTKTSGLANQCNQLDHRQNTLAEHLKIMLANSRTTRTKMEQVANFQDEQMAQYKKMKHNYDRLVGEFKLIGKEIESIFDHIPKPKAESEDVPAPIAKAEDSKGWDTSDEVGGITRSIQGIAQQVQKNSQDIQAVQVGIQNIKESINENTKRVGKYERFADKVDATLEHSHGKIKELADSNKDIYGNIRKQGDILYQTGNTLAKTGEDVGNLHRSAKNLNDSVSRLDKDVGLAHDYFTGLRSGLKETHMRVVEGLLPSPEKQEGSAIKALAALQAPAASFGKPRNQKELPPVQNKKGSGSLTAR